MLAQITALDFEVKALTNRRKELALQLSQCQDEIISNSINRERLIEELRVIDHKNPIRPVEESPEEKDLNRFKGILAELLKKV